MTTQAREKMLAALRFNAMDCDVRTQEADALLARARNLLAQLDADDDDPGLLFPQGPRGRLRHAVEATKYAVGKLEEALGDFPPDARDEMSPSEAMANLVGALRALEAAHRVAPATKDRKPAAGLAGAFTADAAARVPMDYGSALDPSERIQFARGAAGVAERKRYEAHYRKALAGKAAGAPEVAGILATHAYRKGR